MSTIRTFARSYAAAQRRSQQIQKANTRESLRQYKVQEKAQTLQTNRDIVQQYNELIHNLISMHREPFSIIDWKDVSEEPAPDEPQRGNTAEQRARDALHLYSPTLLDKLLVQQKKKVKKLNAALETAKQKDNLESLVAKDAWLADITEWETMQVLAKGILQRDIDSYRDATNKLIPFASLPVGKSLRIDFEPMHVTIDLVLNTDEVIPDTVYTLTSSGKLSEKTMPPSKRNDYYQDHVCSSMIRTAIETVAVLPVAFVVVNGLLDLLNPATGKMDEQAVASVAFVPETLQKLNLANADPSDAVRNFIHNMKFSKSNGFQPVPRIDAKKLVIASH